MAQVWRGGSIMGSRFALAACATVHPNLTRVFTNTGKFPLPPSAMAEAFQRWGAQVVLLPRLSVSKQGTNILMQWQSQVNTSYQLQSSADLGTWSDSASAITGNGAVMTLTSSISNSNNGYFRLN